VLNNLSLPIDFGALTRGHAAPTGALKQKQRPLLWARLWLDARFLHTQFLQWDFAKR
jgi:hypothetical protein